MKSPKKGFDGKVVMVSGAGSGIGRAAALKFARKGCRLALVGRKEAPLKKVAEEIVAAGGSKPLVIANCDLVKKEDACSMVKQIEKEFGRLDIAFNNAGAPQNASSLQDTHTAEFQAVIDGNLTTVFNSMRCEIHLMLKNGSEGGVIINTSSFLGHVGLPGYAAYCAAKFGVLGLTKTSALELADKNIRVNSVSPGPTDTELLADFLGGEENKKAVAGLIPQKRIGTPDEIADAVLHIACPGMSFMTGADIILDGGFTAG